MAGVRLEFAQFGHFDYFNIYRNSVSTAIENLEQPIGTSSTMYYEDLTTEPNNDYYYRIGVIRDSIEEFSEEIYIRAADRDEYFSNVVMISNMSAAVSGSLINDIKGHVFTALSGSTAVIIDDQDARDSKALSVTAGIQSAASNDWKFDGKFTIEIRFKFSSHNDYGGIICSAQANAGWKGWNLLFNGSSNTPVLEINAAFLLSFGQNLNPNTYYEIAIDRDENNIVRIYLDGVVKASGTHAALIDSLSSPLLLGIEREKNQKSVCVFDAVRITKGIARYGGAYTPTNKPYFEF